MCQGQKSKIRLLVKLFTCLGLLSFMIVARFIYGGSKYSMILSHDPVSSRTFSYQSRSTDDSHQGKCKEIHFSNDQCDFLKKNCQHDEVGLLSYLSLYFCDLARAKTLALLIIIAWLGILFASIGISASDFLCINLATIANMLGMSETLAGVTFLAFGNGSPDVFSTWTAFSTHNGSLAVGELIGAASFITTVIAGSMAIVKPFRVSRKSFMRDASFFTIAAAFSMVFLVDGHLSLWESAVMVAFYLLYALIVILWHSMAHRRKKHKTQQARAREHFEISRSELLSNRSRIPSLLGPDEMETMHVRESDFYVEGLHQETQLEIDNDEDSSGSDGDDDEERRERFLSDMSQQMKRSHRRTLSRMATSNQPIRPSLLGALEFGSLLSSLGHQGNQKDYQVPIRRHSEHYSTILNTESHQMYSQPGSSQMHLSFEPNGQRSIESQGLLASNDPKGGRARSASASALDEFCQRQSPANNLLAPPASFHIPRIITPILNQYQGTSANSGSSSPVPAIAINDRTTWQPETITSPTGSFTQPFPPYSDDNSQSFENQDIEILQGEAVPKWYLPRLYARGYFFGGITVPTWSEVRRTFLPNFEDWEDQTLVAKFVSVITAPTILLLTVTVPVVHVDDQTQTNQTVKPGQIANCSSDQNAPKCSLSRQNDRSAASEIPSGVQSSESTTNEDVDDESPEADRVTTREVREISLDDDLYVLWKPWLVGIQIFTAPLFLLFSFFAVDISRLGRSFSWIVLYLIACFLVLVLFAMFIRPGKAPGWQNVLAFPGFCVSIAWVSLIAGEVVGVLKTIGVITEISDAILGLTVFAVGNSLSDLLADLAIARLGYPVMALSACFGGPMLNILLGIGLGGLSLTIKKGHKHAHGGAPALTTHFGIEIGRSLVISGASLLITLIGLLIAVPLNGWIMDRKIGIALICLWTATTIVNVVLEIAMS